MYHWEQPRPLVTLSFELERPDVSTYDAEDGSTITMPSEVRTSGVRNGQWFRAYKAFVAAWSFIIPAFIGVELGLWFYSNYQLSYACSAVLMAGGILTGCISALRFIRKSDAPAQSA